MIQHLQGVLIALPVAMAVNPVPSLAYLATPTDGQQEGACYPFY